MEAKIILNSYSFLYFSLCLLMSSSLCVCACPLVCLSLSTSHCLCLAVSFFSVYFTLSLALFCISLHLWDFFAELLEYGAVVYIGVQNSRFGVACLLKGKYCVYYVQGIVVSNWHVCSKFRTSLFDRPPKRGLTPTQARRTKSGILNTYLYNR